MAYFNGSTPGSSMSQGDGEGERTAALATGHRRQPRGPAGFRRFLADRVARAMRSAIGTTTSISSSEDRSLAALRSFREAYAYDPDENLTAAQGGSKYVRRLSADGDRNLDALTQERALAIAYYLWETNPAAKRAIEITKDFVVGEGVSIDSPDPDVLAVCRRFWHEPVNRLDLKLHDKVRELGLYGEGCWPVSVNEKSGNVQLGYVDPATIVTVKPDPSNCEEPAQVIVRVKVPGTFSTEERTFAVIRADGDLVSPNYGRLIMPGADSCFFFAINKVANATRGRSDLLAEIDWLDAYDQFLFSELDRNILMKSHIWDVTVDGDDKAVERYMAQYGQAPKPGSVRYHNTKIKWEAVTPDLKSAASREGADLILSYIATGFGHPKTWLSGLGDVNKATAVALEEPAMKALSSRQEYVRHILEQLLTFACDQAELRGVLPRRIAKPGMLPPPWPFAVSMPTIRSRDLVAAATTFQQAMIALTTARADEAIDAEAEQQAAVMLLGLLGVRVELEQMQARIEIQRAERESQVARQASVFARVPLSSQGAAGGPAAATTSQNPVVARNNGSQGNLPNPEFTRGAPPDQERAPMTRAPRG